MKIVYQNLASLKWLTKTIERLARARDQRVTKETYGNITKS